MTTERSTVTRVLVLINVLAFLWEVVASGGGVLSLMGSNSVDYHALGALAPNDVLLNHQWWRILTSAFLHASLVHIAVNMFSLWVLGRFIEQVAGSARMALIYAVSLVASGIGVVYLTPPPGDIPTLGASGAIFGLFGALFAIGFKLGPPGMQLIRANLGILAINLVITFWPGAGIAWEAHVGGLVAGFVLTLLIYTPPRRVAPVVVDAKTGDHYETEYQTPEPPR